MELVINGSVQNVDGVKTIQDVIEHFGLQNKPVIAEADGQVLTKDAWPQVEVFPSMRIELVRFVGGG